jgi:Leucine-rich repeat (LRR) protein
LTELREIHLDGNKLSAMHPRMFAHLNNLNRLLLNRNICINKRFNPVISLADVEQELATCGANYPVFLPDLLNVQSQLELLTELVSENTKEIQQIKRILQTKFKN